MACREGSAVDRENQSLWLFELIFSLPLLVRDRVCCQGRRVIAGAISMLFCGSVRRSMAIAQGRLYPIYTCIQDDISEDTNTRYDSGLGAE